MIAVLGSNGQLGAAFLRLLGGDASPVPRTHLDLEDIETIPAWVERNRPETIINCAAYTSVDAAETDRNTARLVNAVAVGALAEAANDQGSKLVTFSTDYVFDGEKTTGYVESDIPNPLNVYGRTKLEGERLALSRHSRALVIRTSWLLSTTHPNFLTTMLATLAEGEVLVVDDQRGRPTFVDDLVRGTLAAMDGEASGVLHLTNSGVATWSQLAREIATLAGYDPNQIKPISSASLDRPALRPANSILDSHRIEDLGLDAMPHYSESLAVALSAAL